MRFDVLEKFLEELNKSNSTNAKISVAKEWLDRHDDLKKLVQYAYDYDKKYWLTKATFDKIEASGEGRGITYISPTAFFDDLDKISAREVRGYRLVGFVGSMIKKYGISKDLMFQILEKDLKCGMNTSNWNKACPGLVKTFEVPLAEKYKDFCDKVSLVSGVLGRKLDGVRTLYFTDTKQFFSREGKEFDTLDKLREEISLYTNLGIESEMKGNGYVIDGEVCLIDSDGKEDFQGIMKEIRRKDHAISNPKFIIFDVLTKEEFENKKSDVRYEDRMSRLLIIQQGEGLEKWDYTPMGELHTEQPNTLVIRNDMYQSACKEGINVEREKATEKGWEGLIWRSSGGVECKRSKGILKVKGFMDDEFEVIDLETSTKQMLIDGRKIDVPCVGNIIIKYQGPDGNFYRVGVGSGMTDAERLEWLEDPEEIIGKMVTVQYFSKTQNQDGSYSLRFPTLKAIHDKGGRDV